MRGSKDSGSIKSSITRLYCKGTKKKGSVLQFELSKKQVNAYKAWAKSHKCNEIRKKANHRYFEFIFVPREIGYSAKVKCSVCRAELDLERPHK